MKTFELLKELLLLQSAGGYDMFDNSVDLAISIHCEKLGIDEQTFRDKLKNIAHIVWDKYDGNHKTWEQHQDTYKQLIDTLA